MIIRGKHLVWIVALTIGVLAWAQDPQPEQPSDPKPDEQPAAPDTSAITELKDALAALRFATEQNTEAKDGEFAAAIRDAEDELKSIQKLDSDSSEFETSKSRLFERMSPIEQLDYEIRWAEERREIKIHEYDHLTKVLFPAYTAYEAEAIRIHNEVERLRPLHPESKEQLDEIDSELKQLLRSQRNTITIPNQVKFSAYAHAGKLTKVQSEIDEREDYRQSLETELDQLKDLEATSNGHAKDPEDSTGEAVSAPKELASYQQLSVEIAELEAELESLKVELQRIERELKSLTELHTAKANDEAALAKQIEESETRVKAAKDALGDRGVFAPVINVFVQGQVLAAERERLVNAKRDTRGVDTRIDILKRRQKSRQERVTEIQDKLLPELQEQYYRDMAETIGWRAGKVVLVFLLAWLLVFIVRRLSEPLVRRFVNRADGKDTHSADEKQRARTLMMVFMTTAKVVVYVMALLFAVAQFDVDYGPLLVAAGGVSLAVGFGAQALVKDFFSGFFILLEDQYSIGDVVELNGKVGTVESLNLRTTVLRSLSGDVHVVPNGEITIVSNMTKGWSRAVVDIGVAYEANTDEVSAVMEAVAVEMNKDAVWGLKMVEHLVVGVQELGDSSVVIRILIKTRAGEQWGVGREYRRRCKLRFDELGIEIPWPQVVVSYKGDPNQDGLPNLPKEIEDDKKDKAEKKQRLTSFLRKHEVSAEEMNERAAASASKEREMVVQKHQLEQAAESGDLDTDEHERLREKLENAEELSDEERKKLAELRSRDIDEDDGDGDDGGDGGDAPDR